MFAVPFRGTDDAGGALISSICEAEGKGDGSGADVVAVAAGLSFTLATIVHRGHPVDSFIVMTVKEMLESDIEASVPRPLTNLTVFRVALKQRRGSFDFELV